MVLLLACVVFEALYKMFGETQAVVGSVEECRPGLVGRHVAGTLQKGGVIIKPPFLSARLFLLDCDAGSESQRDHPWRVEKRKSGGSRAFFSSSSFKGATPSLALCHKGEC